MLEDKPIRSSPAETGIQPAPEAPPLDALFKAPAPAPDPEPKPPSDDLTAIVPIGVPKDLLKLLPMAELNLSPEQAAIVARYHEANVVLGAAGQILICSEACPFKKRCPLYKIGKAPFCYPCPFEANYAVERFAAWLKVIVPPGQHMTETERSTIATLTYLDIDELRCRNILADAENAKLTSLVVRDLDIETKTPLAYEEVIAANSERLSKILYERMTILNAFELTPREKTRKNKFAKKTGSDLASRQSAAADRIRQTSIDAEIVEESE
jgi:hypothetical protein